MPRPATGPLADREHRRRRVGIARQAGVTAALASARLGILREGAARRRSRSGWEPVAPCRRRSGSAARRTPSAPASRCSAGTCTVDERRAEEAHRRSSLLSDQSVKKRGARPLAASVLLAADDLFQHAAGRREGVDHGQRFLARDQGAVGPAAAVAEGGDVAALGREAFAAIARAGDRGSAPRRDAGASLPDRGRGSNGGSRPRST